MTTPRRAARVLVLTGFLFASTGLAQPGAQPERPTASQAPAASPTDPLAPGGVAFDPSAPSALEVKRTPTGHLLVRPMVNGRAPGWFIFDTGAGVCVIAKSVAESLDLRRAGQVDAVGVGGDANASPVFRASTIALGPVTLTDHPVMLADLAFLKQHLGDEIAGVIGYGLLSRCVAEIDIGAPRIALHAPDAFELASRAGDAPPPAWTDLVLNDRVPAVRARFEGREGLFRLDTGANSAVTFHQPAVEKWSLLDGREVTDARLGGVGGFVAAKRGRVAWFELGGVRTENVDAMFAVEAKGTFANATKDGNIGADLLRRFTIVTDYTNRRIAFIPKPPPAK
ncbi:MAG: retropepsin-like aspartic protease [Planctomycetota bacterium]|nr:retropepsin-like aspartic protease [Planctomycetota bacterium]